MKLQDYWRIVKERRRIVMLAFFATVMTTLVGSVLWPAKYEGIATIMLDFDSRNPMNFGNTATPDIVNSDTYVNTQIEIIKSKRISEAALNILNLDKIPEVVKQFNESKAGNTIFFWRDKEKIDIKNWLIGQLSYSLKVMPAKDSRFLYIKFYSPDPAFSAAMANAFAKAYSEYNLELKITPFKEAGKWFSEKLKDAKGYSDKATEQLRAYQQKKGVIAQQGNGYQSGVYDDKLLRLDQLNKDLAEAKVKLFEARVALNRVDSSKGDYESLPEVLNNSFIQNLKTEKVKLDTKLTETSGKLGSNNPQYLRLKSMLDTVNGKLNTEMRNIVNVIKQDCISANQRLEELETAVARLKQESASANLARFEMDSLSRESETYKQVYEAVLKKYNETALQGDINRTNVFLVDAAVPPTQKFSPKIKINIALASFAGLFLGIVLAFLFDFLEDTVKGSEDFERKFGIAVLGTISTVREI